MQYRTPLLSVLTEDRKAAAPAETAARPESAWTVLIRYYTLAPFRTISPESGQLHYLGKSEGLEQKGRIRPDMNGERLTNRTSVPRRACAYLPPICYCALLAGSAGCQSTHANRVAFLRADEQVVSTGEYMVAPPDAIVIHAPVAPEIDGVAEQVRPDGKIALRLLGEVEVAGLTTDQIAAKLRDLLARYYVEPEVVIDVTRYASQYYYVFGEVRRPGPKPYTGRDTLLHALSEAEPTFLAAKSQIRLVRPGASERESKIITVDLKKMVHSGCAGDNVLLQAGDVIEVPPTPLAWLGLRVRELLFPVQPAVDAYNAPADAILSNRIYRDEFGSDDHYDGYWRR
jgi:polysaccharide export outer membrane protein